MTRGNKVGPLGWWGLGFEYWQLGIDTTAVMGLRAVKLSRGGSAAMREANLMVAEKIDATLELQMDMLTGRIGSTPAAASRRILRHYGAKVRANRRRLR